MTLSDLVVNNGKVIDGPAVFTDHLLNLRLKAGLRYLLLFFQVSFLLLPDHLILRHFLLHKHAEFRVAVIPHVKVRVSLTDTLPHIAKVQRLSAVLRKQRRDRLFHRLYAGHVLQRIMVKTVFFIFIIDQIQIDKFITGPRQCRRRLGLAHAQHILFFLPEPHGKPREITVAGHQTKSVHLVLIQKIHGIDDHRHIRGIFSGCIRKLLNRCDGILKKHFLRPAVSFRPVPVDPPAGGKTVFLQFIKNRRRVF